jgi:TRAP-type C4-dicarboxylate transport system permease small subunit
MIALLIGIILILFGVYAVLPFNSPGFLNWTQDVLAFLRGGVPIVAFLIGLVAFFIGIADIKDKIEAKKEEKEEKEEAEEPKEKEED